MAGIEPAEKYRLCAMMRQQGVNLPTSTVNDWMHACADKLYLLYLRLKQRIMSQNDYMQADKVPFNIADLKGKVRKGYAWQVNDCTGRHLGRYFHYDNGSREKTVPQGLFTGFRGIVQVDGYAGYDFLDLCPDIDQLEWLTKVLALPLLDMDDDALDNLLPQYQPKSTQD